MISSDSHVDDLAGDIPRTEDPAIYAANIPAGEHTLDVYVEINLETRDISGSCIQSGFGHDYTEAYFDGPPLPDPWTSDHAVTITYYAGLDSVTITIAPLP